ncbi:cytochrome P450 [Saccharothrix xinjiangensis]
MGPDDSAVSGNPDPGSHWPIPRTCPLSLPDEYADLRRSAPLVPAKVWGGTRTWLVTRHEQARALLADPRVSVDPARLPRLSEGEGDGSGGGFLSMLMMDPPGHTAIRRMFISEFSVRRIREMRAGIERTVMELLDRLVTLTPPVDLVRELALPMSTQVICQLLGVPYEDREFFHERSEKASKPHDEGALEALLELVGYLDGLIAAKTSAPDDGLLGTVIRQRLHTGELSHRQLVDNSVLLLAAGHETSANMVGLGALTLLRHPDALATLRARPELMPDAVDELLRLHTIADGLRRVATEDIEVDGRLVRAGDGLIMLLASSNHDDSVFADPAAFDLHRRSNPHVAFGFGPHQCLGQHLARLELEVTLGSLIERLPGLRLAGEPGDLSVKTTSVIFGLDELLVTW